jgi:hypothetical protein
MEPGIWVYGEQHVQIRVPDDCDTEAALSCQRIRRIYVLLKNPAHLLFYAYNCQTYLFVSAVRHLWRNGFAFPTDTTSNGVKGKNGNDNKGDIETSRLRNVDSGNMGSP